MHLYPHIFDPDIIPRLARMGPEVLITKETDPAFARNAWTLEKFRERAGRSKQAIKAFLLDQKRQSGLGNMYVCEALYEARISPLRPAKTLTYEETETLHNAARSVLSRAISSHLDYEDVLRVYQRALDPTGLPVSIVQIQRRKTFWVPALQA